MPKLSVDTYPVKGYVQIFRATPGYNLLAQGEAPQAAEGSTPWGYVVKLGDVENGGHWVPVFREQRGIVEKDDSLRFRYVKV